MGGIFDNLGNDFDDELQQMLDTPVKPAAEIVHTPLLEMHIEKCKSCRGTGQFISYSGRILGQCFKCKGKGQKAYRTSAADREKARVKTAEKKAAAPVANWDAFVEAHPEVAAWIIGAPKFEFAQSMKQAVQKFGSLTERQMAACLKCVASTKARAAAVAANDTRKVELNVELIVKAFEGCKLQKPKIRLAHEKMTFVVYPAPAAAGTYYVRDADKSRDLYLGKIVGKTFSPSRDCTDEARDGFVAACADPKASAVAYGRLTGSCSNCGAALTDPVSVANGIGPICAGRFNW